MGGDRRRSHVESRGGYFTGEWLNVEVRDGPDNTVWDFLEHGPSAINFLQRTAAKASGYGKMEMIHLIANDGARSPLRSRIKYVSQPHCIAASKINLTQRSSKYDDAKVDKWSYQIDDQVHEMKAANGKIYTYKAFWIDRRHPDYQPDEGDTLVILQLGDDKKAGHSRGFDTKRYIDRDGFMHVEMWYQSKADSEPLRMTRIFDKKDLSSEIQARRESATMANTNGAMLPQMGGV
jgi:hypothetical protein